MSGLNDSQLAVIRAILDSAPDNALGTLNKALSAQAGPGAMGEIQRMVRGEVSDRRARDLTFAPLLPLCPKAPPPWTQQTFPARTLPLLWSAVASERPELVQAARAAANVRQPEDLHVEAFDLVCREAAAGLRCPSGTGYAPVAAFLDAATPAGAQLFGSYLDLTPLCRSVLEQMPDWLARMTEERAAGVRVAYNDAVEIAPDAGPRFFELMQAQLGEPWLILRLLSAVMFRPSDTYAASSELACFGDRLLDYVGRQIDALRKFDPEAGASAGVAAAEAARIAVLTLSEFEHSLELSKVSKWGGLISRYKQDLAMLVEIRFRKTDDLVALALPLKPPGTPLGLCAAYPS